MKYTCECLVIKDKDGNTIPLEIELPDDTALEEIENIRKAGWEAGQRMKLGFDL